jgi:hydroxyacylglutathione hydrolase
MPSTVHTISLGFVNSYLVETGAGFILVDTGIRATRGNLERALDRAGCKPGNLKLILLTHGDIDHTANGAYLREKYQAQIGMHQNDAAMVENGDLNRTRKIKSPSFKLMMTGMRILGITQKMTAEFVRFKPDVYLEDGQTLNAFGLDATVLHLPGHTQGSIAILTAEGELISGDTLENRGSPQPAMIVDDEPELADSVGRLAALAISTVYPGHGKPFSWGQFPKQPKI